MDGTLRDGVVFVGGDARQRFYDSRGYGRPLAPAEDGPPETWPVGGDAVALAPVEAAHLLYRDDLDAVVTADGDDRLSFRRFFERMELGLRFVVYKDLRDRGFYLSPAVHVAGGSGGTDGDVAAGSDADADTGVDTDPDPDTHEDAAATDSMASTADSAVATDAAADFVVYPRGEGPWGDAVEHRVHVLGERRSVPAASLSGGVLAVVDEDGDLTYFDTEWIAPSGPASDDPPTGVEGVLLEDRVTVWEPPTGLYDEGFYGQRLEGRDAETGPLQLSLVEAAHLARTGALTLSAETVLAHGREVEGERFDRRLAVYRALREAGVVPKSGFKFGADFRTYESFDGVADMGHSESLVRVVAPDHAFVPRDLSLDVRLAGGVRKRMVFALTDARGDVDWLSVARLTP
ncbi:MAG: tRNA-intron lyase [Halolamina sp.]